MNAPAVSRASITRGAIAKRKAATMTDAPMAPPSRSRRNAMITAAILLLVAALAWYATRASSPASAPRSRRGGATAAVANAALADMPITVNAIGSVQPIVAATVRTQLSGVLFSLHFEEGQIVRKGQLLAQIDPRPYRLALSQQQANLLRDQAQLNVAQVQLGRFQTLLSQDSIARQQVDTQAATVKQLQGTVDADQAAIGTARLNLDYTSIKAPVSGRIGLRQADLGNFLTPSDAAGIAVITQTDPIDVSFTVPQNELPAVQAKLVAGAHLTATALDQTGSTVLARGRFLTFDNQIDTTSGTVKAKARFPDPAGKLFPNQFVSVSLLVDTLHDAVTVPVTSVRHGARGDFVFVLQPGDTVKMRAVRTGPSDTGKIAILAGVSAGDPVITEGADGLDDGSKVVLPGTAGRREDAGRANGDGGGRHRHPHGVGQGAGGAGGGATR